SGARAGFAAALHCEPHEGHVDGGQLRDERSDGHSEGAVTLPYRPSCDSCCRWPPDATHDEPHRWSGACTGSRPASAATVARSKVLNSSHVSDAPGDRPAEEPERRYLTGRRRAGRGRAVLAAAIIWSRRSAMALSRAATRAGSRCASRTSSIHTTREFAPVRTFQPSRCAARRAAARHTSTSDTRDRCSVNEPSPTGAS